METKKFNRKFFLRGLCGGICLVLLVSVALVVYTIASGYWSIAGVALLVLASALVIMIDIFDRDSDITVDYVKRVVRSNIKFDENKTICVPFESMAGVSGIVLILAKESASLQVFLITLETLVYLGPMIIILLPIIYFVMQFLE